MLKLIIIILSAYTAGFGTGLLTFSILDKKFNKSLNQIQISGDNSEQIQIGQVNNYTKEDDIGEEDTQTDVIIRSDGTIEEKSHEKYEM